MHQREKKPFDFGLGEDNNRETGGTAKSITASVTHAQARRWYWMLVEHARMDRLQVFTAGLD